MRYTAVFIVAAAFFLAPGAFAADEDIQYETITSNKVKCDVGILYTETDDGIELKVAAVATGKGADFRRWAVTDIKLEAAGEAIRPSSTEKSWGGEASFFRLPAAFVFAAIGTQYERYGSECSSSGQTCPVTGQPTGGSDAHPGYKGSVARGIDKAGMAAGMGLLTAQAKGEIPVLKSYFILDRDLAAKFLSGELKVKIKAENKEKKDVRKADVDISKQFAKFIKKHPGVQREGGVPPAGTFVTVSEKKEETKEAGAKGAAGPYYGGKLKQEYYPEPQEYPGDKEADKKLLREEKMKKAKEPLAEGMAASAVGAPVPSEKAPDVNPMLKKNQDDYLRHSKRLKEIDPNSEEAKAIREALPKFEKEIKEMGGEVPSASGAPAKE